MNEYIAINHSRDRDLDIKGKDKAIPLQTWTDPRIPGG